MKLNVDHHQSISFPFAFEIVDSARDAILSSAGKWPFMRNLDSGVLFISGATGRTLAHISHYMEVFERSFGCRCFVHQVSDASMAQARAIDETCARTGISLLVAVGGGTVIDVAKMVVKLRGTPLIVVPSVLSSDCIASPISVLRNDAGVRVSLSSGIPSCLIVDLSLARTAPPHLTLSGLGDVVSNASALLDLAEYEARFSKSVDGFSKILSLSAFEMILGLTRAELGLASGYRKVAIGLVLSGMSMSFAGNSSPCSGAEHLVSHAIDDRGYGEGTHGLQVGIATAYCAALRRVLGLATIEEPLGEYFLKVGFPHRPEQIGVSRNQFLECVMLGPSMRPARYTFLSDMPGLNTLEEAYELAFTG
jgi:glycerol-1-phosphate dehydrogenase [NAD(P)+]